MALILGTLRRGRHSTHSNCSTSRSAIETPAAVASLPCKLLRDRRWTEILALRVGLYARGTIAKARKPCSHRKSPPSDPAFSHRTAHIKGKLEFRGKDPAACKLQAGTVIAQIGRYN